MNTEQSPATSTTVAEGSFDTKQFKAFVDELKTDAKNLVDLAKLVAVLGPSESYPAVDANGRQIYIGRKQLTTLRSQYISKLNSLNKIFTQATKKKKRASKPGVGPASLLKEDSELLNFFVNADFGPAYTIINGACVQNGELRDKLPLLLNEGVYGGRMLPILFSVYARYQNMQYPDRPTVYSASQEMRQFLQGTFNDLTQENLRGKPRTKRADKRDVEEGLASKTGETIAYPAFSPDQMLFYDFPRIISKNTLDKKTLSDARRSEIDSAEYKIQLEAEYRAVKETLDCLKAVAQAEKQANAPPKTGAARRRRQTSPAAAQGPLPPVIQPMTQRSASPTRSVSSGRSSPTGSIGSGGGSPRVRGVSPLPNIQGVTQSTMRRVPGLLPNVGANVIGGEEEEM